MNDTPIMRGLFALAFLIGVVPGGLGIAVLMGNGDLSSNARLLFGSIWIAVTLAIVSGLVLCPSRPRLGIGLVAAGVVAISIGMFWIFFITLPAGGAIVYLAYRRARLGGWSGALHSP